MSLPRLSLELINHDMKKYTISLLIGLLSFFSLHAQDTAFGYGSAATGGAGGSVVTVSSISALQNEMKGTTAKVVIITQSLTFSQMTSIENCENKTLMALPGVVLKSNRQDASTSGILYFKSSKNIILRNLNFEGPGAYDCDGNDLLCFDGVTKAWVDHCDFHDGCDGNFDNKGKTDNVTVSWCRFHYLKPPKAGGSGGSNDHRYTNLLGSSSSDKPADGTYNFTWAYCWWDEGCRERMVRGRNASLHFLNCYWNSSVANYYVGPENMDAYFENCTFKGAPAKAKIFYQNYGGTNGAKFVGCQSDNGVPADINNRTVRIPTYAYATYSAQEAVTRITDATCGAGATLQVTASGQVQSACQTGSGPTDYSNIYHFEPTLTSGDLTVHAIVASSEGGVMRVAGMKQAGSISYDPSGLKLSGGGADSLAVTLNQPMAEGDVIEAQLYYMANTTARGLRLRDGAQNQVADWSQETDGSVFTRTYTILPGDGLAGTNYFCLQRNNSIFIQVLKVRRPSVPTSVEEVPEATTVQKIWRDGALYILRDGETFDVMGRKIY